MEESGDGEWGNWIWWMGRGREGVGRVVAGTEVAVAPGRESAVVPYPGNP